MSPGQRPQTLRALISDLRSWLCPNPLTGNGLADCSTEHFNLYSMTVRAPIPGFHVFVSADKMGTE